MPAHRLRRWPGIMTTLGQYVVSAEQQSPSLWSHGEVVDEVAGEVAGQIAG